MIGTSQGGRFLPVDLAKAGKKVALVERGQLGGVCVNTGCTPTKTPGLPGAPLRGVRRAHWSGVGGPGRGARAQAGHGRRLAAELREPVIVIDAGTRPKPLAITGLGDVRVLDSTSIMELDELPEHLIIPGGGYIGPEFGQIFRRFGSEVTIVQSAPRLMMIEDEDVSDEVAAILRDDGITVLTSSTPVRVKPPDGGRVRLTVRTPDGEQQREGSHLLSVIGRIPNTEALTPEAAGIRLNDRGFIEVDEYLETSVPGVYAMGDVKAGWAPYQSVWAEPERSFWCLPAGVLRLSGREGIAWDSTCAAGYAQVSTASSGCGSRSRSTELASRRAYRSLRLAPLPRNRRSCAPVG